MAAAQGLLAWGLLLLAQLAGAAPRDSIASKFGRLGEAINKLHRTDGSTLGVQAAEEDRHDVALNGPCRPDILYHCAHVLTEHQRLESFKARTEGAAAAAAFAQAAVEHVAGLTGHQQDVSIKTIAGKNGGSVTVKELSSLRSKDQGLGQLLKASATGTAAASSASKAAGSVLGATKAAGTKAAGEGGVQAAAGAKQAGSTGSKAGQQAATEKATASKAGTKATSSSSGSAAAGQAQNAAASGSAAAGKASAASSTAAAAAAGAADSQTGAIVKETATTDSKASSGQLRKRVGSVDSTDEDEAFGGKDGVMAADIDQEDDDIKALDAVAAKALGSSSAILDAAAAIAAAAEEEEEVAQLENDEVEAATKAARDAARVAAATTAAATDSVVDDAADADDDADAAGQGHPDDVDDEDADNFGSDNLLTVDGADGADGDAAKLKRQQRRGRSLMGSQQHVSWDLLGEREFHRHESAALKGQQEYVTKVLTTFKLNPNTPVTYLTAASAPIARCLRQAIRLEAMSISPDAPSISMECKAEVRELYIERAKDVRRDLPLLAACAKDIATGCNSTGSSQVLTCLKGRKRTLQPLCRLAVVQRQVDASEDIELDPDLSEACRLDRDRLCGDAGWGEGAAQECLEYHLHGETLGGGPGAGGSGNTGSSGGGKGGAHARLGLSPPCAAALFRRQMEEAEDIRFNYRLSSACAGDKQVFCRDVRPGLGDVVGCLEHHREQPGFSERCAAELDYNAQLRAHDVRLDARFLAVCSPDVRSLCYEEEARILTNPAEPPGEGARVLECMRRSLPRIRAPACAAHVSRLMRASYRDSRLDGLLMSRCDADVERSCIDRRSALGCLKARLAKHEPLEPECIEAVRERDRQAAADLSFIPDLEDACGREVHEFCSGAHLKGAAVIDCLADSRHEQDFGPKCRTQLVSYLADAVSDVRMLHTLREDCADDIRKLCNATQPGQGRVLACLQENRADIEGEGCKRQMLRLLGLMVEDVRLDFNLLQACKADMQQFCAGVKADAGGSYAGAVHQCLRNSWDHLSPDCREAEEGVEELEHEDVRLNPRIQKACPVAIADFCADVPAGNANVISCLAAAASKPHFPEPCRAVMTSLMARASVKYSLNAKLKAACDTDVQRLCPDAEDEFRMSSHSTDNSVLGCLAANSSALGVGCRAELAALVRVHLNRYTPGMPLTSPCDGDVLARCNVDKQVAPYLMGGYIQSCLAKHVDKLYKPCWSLLSMFDERQYSAATTLEAKHWTPQLQQEAVDKVAAQVAADVAAKVRGELEPQLLSNLHQRMSAALEAHSQSIKPVLFALINTVSVLLSVMGATALLAWYGWKRITRMRGEAAGARTRTIAIKDGRV